MSAGPGTPSSSPDPQSAQPVNKLGVTARLGTLAPLHQRALLRQAARACGVAEAPTLGDLKHAESPPTLRTRTESYQPLPTPEAFKAAVKARTQEILTTPELRERLLRNREGADERRRWRLATFYAECDVERRRHEWRTVTVAINKAQYDEGQAHAARMLPMLAWLDSAIARLERHIPHLYLAAMPEGDLKELACRRASAERELQAIVAKEVRSLEGAAADVRRRGCHLWQRRDLRRKAASARLNTSAHLKTTGRGGAPYADGYSVQRWRERQDDAESYGRAHAVRFEDKSEVSLLALMQAGTRAAVSRIYAMTKGMDEVAKKAGLVACFVTVTAPAEYHPNPSMGTCSWTPEHTLQAAKAELMDRFARIRARMTKGGITPFGMRVLEPHEDGTPHLHILFYVRPGQVRALDRILRAVCPEPVPGKRVATKRVATKLKLIRPRKGKRGASPASYMLKYIVKSLNDPDAAAVLAGGNVEDGDHLANHDRVRAWGTEMRARRFDFVGTRGCQRIWQRLHTASTEEMAGAPPNAMAAWSAIKERRWGDALHALGAVPGFNARKEGDGESEERPSRIRLGYATERTETITARFVVTTITEDGEVLAVTVENGETTTRTVPLKNRYGEPTKRPAWLVDKATGWKLPLRRRACSIVRVEAEDATSQDTAIAKQDRVQDGKKLRKEKGVTIAESYPRR